jgi:hypothetical protein
VLRPPKYLVVLDDLYDLAHGQELERAHHAVEVAARPEALKRHGERAREGERA